MIETKRKTSKYKKAFVEFIESFDWDLFITIGVGACPDDEDLLRRLRIIEAKFCKKYIAKNYNKLPDGDRFSMAVAFEGERKLGNRHAHILARVPHPMKRCDSRERLINIFPGEFESFWHMLTPLREQKPTRIMFGDAHASGQVYTVKSVQDVEVPWSRFEFVTPPKVKTFQNENLSVIRNRDRQKRILLQGTKSTEG